MGTVIIAATILGGIIGNFLIDCTTKISIVDEE